MAKISNAQLDVIHRKCSRAISERLTSIARQISSLKDQRSEIKHGARKRHEKAFRNAVIKFIKSVKKADMVNAMINSLSSDCRGVSRQHSYDGQVKVCNLKGYNDAVKGLPTGELGEIIDMETYYTKKELHAIAQFDIAIGVLEDERVTYDVKFEEFMDELILGGDSELNEKLQKFIDSLG